MSKILVVDNESSRDLLSRRLKREGFEIMVARTGNEGIEVAQNELPNLILVNINSLIPQDGEFMIQKLKMIPTTQKIPIIVIIDPETPLEKQNIMGVDDYEVKPIERTRLLEKINRLLSSPDSSDKICSSS